MEMKTNDYMQEVNTDIANCKNTLFWTVLSSEKRAYTLWMPFKCRTANFGITMFYQHLNF